MDYRGIEILLLSLGEKLSIDANNNMDPFFFFFWFHFGLGDPFEHS